MQNLFQNIFFWKSFEIIVLSWISSKKYQYHSSIQSHLLHYAFSKNKLLVYTNERKNEDVKRCVNDSEDCSSHHLIRYILDWQDTYIAILSFFNFIWEAECISSYWIDCFLKVNTADKISYILINVWSFFSKWVIST